MAFKGFDEVTVLFVPDVYPRVWSGKGSGCATRWQYMCLELTFAAADNEILVGAAERTPDDVFALLLAYEPLDDLRGVDVDQVDFAVGHVDEHLPRISADVDARHPAFVQDTVLFPTGLEIIHDDLAFAGDDNQSLAIRGDCTILNAVADVPIVNGMSFYAPEDEPVSSMQASSHERLPVR